MKEIETIHFMSTSILSGKVMVRVILVFSSNLFIFAQDRHV